MNKPRPRLAGGRHPLGPLLERGDEGAQEPAGILYFWKGERPRHPNAPQLEGTGEIRVEPPTAPPGTGRHDRIATPV